MRKRGWALAAAALAVAGAAAAPAVSQPARAAGSATPVQHIVVLMMENHTADNVLGDWCNANPARCPAGGIPPSVTLSDGSVVTPSAAPDTVPAVSHTVASQAAAIDGGKMDGWQQLPGCGPPSYSCVSYYPAASQPNLTSLATAYGVLDHAFTQADAPSWGGHLEELAATTGGFLGNNPYHGTGPGWGCDSGKVASWQPSPGAPLRNVPSCIPYYAPGLLNGGAFRATPAAHVPTILDEMDTAGVTWDIYAPTAAQAGYQWAGCPSFADCLDTSQKQNMVPDSRFFTAAAAGKLPGVSFVMPGTAVSQHNLQSMAAGDNWIGKVASAVMSGPQWPSTALFITDDDCGCFYDHVAPPAGPDGRQMGPRVPFLVISPWVKPASTDSTVTSSTGSILAYIESTFGLPAMNANDAGAYNLQGMFSYTAAPRLAHPRMTWRHLPASAYRVNPLAANDGT